ncbi:MAG: adenylate/guanylate cyclase domain-containing protein [Chitinophagales bacterium]
MKPFIAAMFCGLMFCGSVTAQDKEEQLRKLKDDLKQQQREIQFIQEQHDEMKKKQLDQLSKEKAEKEQELQRSMQEAKQSQADLQNSKQQLQVTMQEASKSKKDLALTQEQILKAQEELRHQEDSIRLLTQEQDLKNLQLNNQKLELEKQSQSNRYYLAVIGLGSLVLLALVGLYFVNHRKNRELAAKNKVIEEEKKRSEDLLLNILPEDVVEELKSQGKTNAKSYQQATVLFADIKDFTSISEKLTAEDLVSSLDAYFEAFDKIIEKHNVEKIKTIGDAYVCVGGVPVANESNPYEIVRVGLEFQKAVKRLSQERQAVGKPFFEVRIGIHSGPLVAGVVGIKKFAYDIWGDTVNMAARMQQFGEPLMINISRDTYEIIKEKFACVFRGKVDVKGKGEVEMYFVDREL